PRIIIAFSYSPSLGCRLLRLRNICESSLDLFVIQQKSAEGPIQLVSITAQLTLCQWPKSVINEPWFSALLALLERRRRLNSLHLPPTTDSSAIRWRSFRTCRVASI